MIIVSVDLRISFFTVCQHKYWHKEKNFAILILCFIAAVIQITLQVDSDTFDSIDSMVLMNLPIKTIGAINQLCRKPQNQAKVIP